MAVKWPEVLSLQALAANVARRVFRTYSALSNFSCVRLPIAWPLLYRILFGTVLENEMSEK